MKQGGIYLNSNGVYYIPLQSFNNYFFGLFFYPEENNLSNQRFNKLLEKSLTQDIIGFSKVKQSVLVEKDYSQEYLGQLNEEIYSKTLQELHNSSFYKKNINK